MVEDSDFDFNSINKKKDGDLAAATNVLTVSDPAYEANFKVEDQNVWANEDEEWAQIKSDDLQSTFKFAEQAADNPFEDDEIEEGAESELEKKRAEEILSPSEPPAGPTFKSSSFTAKHQKKKSIQIKNLPIVPNQPASSVALNSIPKSTSTKSFQNSDEMIFAVCLVDFHHLRGPEIEWWISNYGDKSHLFPNLPFQALPDGSHLFQETFSNFNLLYDVENDCSPDPMSDDYDFTNVTTLFGCACVRQIKSDQLTEKNENFTRSTVQKAVVILSRKPLFNKIREKLSIITNLFFDQKDFSDKSILESLFTNLNLSYDSPTKLVESFNEFEYYINLNLKKFLLKFNKKFLVIFKLLLIEKKILIFSNNIENLIDFQYNLISLIPNLVLNLDDCGSPSLVNLSKIISKPMSLVSNDRNSLLNFFGMPLQIFNKNGFFYPYISLQQLEDLHNPKSQFYIVGSSNQILLSQKIADVIINLDDNTLDIVDPSLNSILNLSYSDKKFIEELINQIMKNFNNDSNFLGNDDYIRYQFEDYLISILATTKYSNYQNKYGMPPPGFENDLNFGNLELFNIEFINAWKQTNNYRIWEKKSDDFLFNFFPPKHVGIDLANLNFLKRLSNSFYSNQSARERDSKIKKFIDDDTPLSPVSGNFPSSTPSSANGVSNPNMNSATGSSLQTHSAGKHEYVASPLSSGSITEEPKPDHNISNIFSNWSSWAFSKKP